MTRCSFASAFPVACGLWLLAVLSGCQGASKATPMAPTGSRWQELLGGLSGVHAKVTGEHRSNRTTRLLVDFSAQTARLEAADETSHRQFRLLWADTQTWPAALLEREPADSAAASVCGRLVLMPVRQESLRQQRILLELTWKRAPGLENAITRTMTSSCNWLRQAEGQYVFVGKMASPTRTPPTANRRDGDYSPCPGAPAELAEIWKRCQHFAVLKQHDPGLRSAALACLGGNHAVAAQVKEAPGASGLDAKNHWLRALRITHPDVTLNREHPQCASESAKLVNAAYQSLK